MTSLIGCQQGEPAPTVRVILPTIIPTFTAPPPTLESASLDVTDTPVLQRRTLPPSFTPTATHSITPTPTPPSYTPTATNTITPSPLPSATRQRPPLPDMFSFGKSALGNNLVGHRFGEGGIMIMLVGGIHTGFESNTVTLVDEMVANYRANPSHVLPGVTLVLIPALNVDAVPLGRQLPGRFNVNNVDLNRNWSCGWESSAYFKNGEVNPGQQPFSEPESIALAALINDLRPDTVLFYHSAANGVFPGHCGAISNSFSMAQVYAEASQYPYSEEFTDYVVTGSGADWVDGLGIPAADVELASADLPELTRNLRGVAAIQCWLLGSAGRGFTVCNR